MRRRAGEDFSPPEHLFKLAEVFTGVTGWQDGEREDSVEKEKLQMRCSLTVACLSTLLGRISKTRGWVNDWNVNVWALWRESLMELQDCARRARKDTAKPHSEGERHATTASGGPSAAVLFPEFHSSSQKKMREALKKRLERVKAWAAVCRREELLRRGRTDFRRLQDRGSQSQEVVYPQRRSPWPPAIADNTHSLARWEHRNSIG